MRSLRALGLGVMIVVVAATSSHSQTNPLRDLWPQATAAAEGGDIETANRRLSELMNAGRSNGVGRFPVFAESAVALARNAQREGNVALANWGMSAAATLDPKSPDAAFGSAALALERRDWARVTASTLRGFTNAATVYSARQKAQMDLLIVLALAIAGVSAVFALVMLVRHGARAVHDLSEWLGTKLSPSVAIALAWGVMFLPLFFTLGPQWLLLWWIALLFGYATTVERVVAAILLVLVALTPAAVEWASWRIGSLTSPVIRGAAAVAEKSYRPGTLRRLRDMAESLTTQPHLQALAGTLEAQEGNETQAASYLKRAIELSPNLAGAQLNLGNLHFLNNDFAAAITQYDAAARTDPSMAIAYYNQSVAAGELYRFDLQGQKLEEAKSQNRSLVTRLLANPPAQKIVPWSMPMKDAWSLHRMLARDPASREFFGNYASFSPQRAWANPLTVGATIALLLGGALTLRRRRRGFAGSCVKCGRTFCGRCKSSRESATYCTQCIHIYLKRDGVSLDTKRRKLEEVQKWQQRTNRTRRLFATVFPGSGQMLEGAFARGITGLLLFFVGVGVAVLAGRLAPIATPADAMILAMRTAGILLAVIAWFAFAIPSWRSRMVQG